MARHAMTAALAVKTVSNSPRRRCHHPSSHQCSARRYSFSLVAEADHQQRRKVAGFVEKALMEPVWCVVEVEGILPWGHWMVLVVALLVVLLIPSCP